MRSLTAHPKSRWSALVTHVTIEPIGKHGDASSTVDETSARTRHNPLGPVVALAHRSTAVGALARGAPAARAREGTSPWLERAVRRKMSS